LAEIEAEPVKVAPDERVLEPMVPPLRVKASTTSLSAHGLVVLTQLPVMVSSCEREAGPPAPQSRLMTVSVVPLAVRVNLP